MKRLCVGLILVWSLAFQIGAVSLDDQFKHPPEQSRPWCYWYWISNHIPKEGVTNDLGLLWKPPFVVDVTEHLTPGKNELRVDVTHLWSNRLVGELKYPDGFPGLEK